MKNLTLAILTLVSALIPSCTRKISKPEMVERPNEIINDGYTQISAHNKTGASNSIEHDKTILKLDDHLRGLAGVNVSGSGSGARIIVRGINSFQSSSTEPLFIISNNPMPSYSEAYTAVNPIDIKRVTVLSDASSTAIYGVRGANGVIVIELRNSN